MTTMVQKRIYLYLLVCLAWASSTKAQMPLSQELAQTAMRLWPDSFLIGNDKAAKWRYDQGVILKGIELVWKQSGKGSWYNYIQRSMDFHLTSDGRIRGYKPGEFNIDHINNGKLLLLLYRVTENKKYKLAADQLRQQLREHPRTREGGFWHKQVYPWQMWLDGLYMAQPFYAEYAKLFHEDTAFNDIAKQFILMEKNARDPETGWLYHGYDESRLQQWADKQTGRSPHVWGRALGWYGMALVDVLDYFPEQHPQRAALLQILKRFVRMAAELQDKSSGVWYDIPNLPNEKGNYREASASCMLTYTMAKAVRKGYVDDSYRSIATRAYQGIQKEFIRREEGAVNLHGTVAVSGLGGKPYRDGSFAYYMSEPVIVNDPKGLGAAILCAAEMEQLAVPQTGKGKKVVLDRYFNSEKKKDITGKDDYWHYVWNVWSHPGFGLLQQSFEKYGARVANLDEAPHSGNLKEADIYIIVDPDHAADKTQPNYMTKEYADAIAAWVKKGGVLLLMANDSANCDLVHFNQLAERFGIGFTNQVRNAVQGTLWEQGAFELKGNDGIFRAGKIFLKGISTLSVKAPAATVLANDGDVIMARARYGRGIVFAVGDPWLYNEYVDGRRLPADFDNLAAAEDLACWLLKNAKP